MELCVFSSLLSCIALKIDACRKCRDGVNAALNASKKAPVWCSIYKVQIMPVAAGGGSPMSYIRHIDCARAGVCWRCDNRHCDFLTGWSVLRLLSQFVRLLSRRTTRSAHTLLNPCIASVSSHLSSPLRAHSRSCAHVPPVLCAHGLAGPCFEGRRSRRSWDRSCRTGA